MSNHELTQIFYDGLVPQDRYLLDVASGDTFINSYKEGAIEFTETLVDNCHHNTTKSLG